MAAGELDKLKGKIKEKTGEIINNDELQAKGQADQKEAKLKDKAEDKAEIKKKHAETITQEKREAAHKEAREDQNNSD
ncbi:CsbD family protein [Loigolactobacillus iwatensis]|uniref:CsbD family protein n=1 Tax=Loigolactobacillus iwatensis TaxID=1267156 RepID=UPI000F7DE788|nr:CsbD family protein [Loigolactobacillus iwatensis]